MNVSFLQELMNSVAEQGRALLPRALFGSDDEQSIEVLSRALMSGRGEASGVAIARQLLVQLKKATSEERFQFYRFLADEMQPDALAVAETARGYLDDPSAASLAALQKASYSPRLEFFRRLNLAPGATADIVELRGDLMRHIKSDEALAAVNRDLERLLTSWFNRGFLVLAADRLADAGGHTREDHRLRSGPRNPRLGRLASPSRSQGPALLCILSSGSRR